MSARNIVVLMFVTLVVGLACGWWLADISPSRERAALIEELRRSREENERRSRELDGRAQDLDRRMDSLIGASGGTPPETATRPDEGGVPADTTSAQTERPARDDSALDDADGEEEASGAEGIDPGAQLALEWKFRRGSVLRYKLTERQVITVRLDTTRNEASYVFREEVLDVDGAGVGTTVITFERVMYKSGFMKVEYDSETDAGPPSHAVGRAVAALKGKSITLTVNPRGEILSLRGCVAQVLEELDEDSWARKAAQGLFNDGRMESLMQQKFVVFPKKPIDESEGWETLSQYSTYLVPGDHREFRVKQEVRIGMRNKCRIHTRGKGVANVSQKTEFDIKSEEYGGPGVDYARAAASFDWLIDRGVVASATSTTTMGRSMLLFSPTNVTSEVTFKLMLDQKKAAPTTD